MNVNFTEGSLLEMEILKKHFKVASDEDLIVKALQLLTSIKNNKLLKEGSIDVKNPNKDETLRIAV